MADVKTSQKTLIDLYLAFVRTWILEYQLNSISRTAEELTSNRSVLASADAPPGADVETPSEADASIQRAPRETGSTGSSRGPVAVGKRIPPLKAAPERAVAVASRPKQKPRIDKLKLPKVARMVLEDCVEHWRDLAKALEARVQSHGLKTILVTGGNRGEGCTTVALCLAVTVARRTKRRCLLVDADFAHPGLAEQLGLTPAVGLEEVLVEKRPLERAILVCGDPKLDLVLLREGLELPAMALGGTRINRVMEKARERYDLVIMDGGCRFDNGRAKPLPPGVDAALLVHNRTATSEWLIDKLDRELAARGISCLGVIENEP